MGSVSRREDAMRDSRDQQRSPRINLVGSDQLETRIRSALGPGFELRRNGAEGCELWLVSADPDLSPGGCTPRENLERSPDTPWIALLPEGAASTLARTCLQAGAIDAIPLEILDTALEAAVRSALADTRSAAPAPDRRRFPQADPEAQAHGLELALDGVREAYDQTLAALVAALDCREKETACHSQRVATFSIRIALGLGLEQIELEDLYRGALLHDIGKIGTPDAILLKPGALTPAEWEVMREHPEQGFRLIEDIAFLDRARCVLLCHHEAWDGSGYPAGLAGDEIPLPARIFAVAHTYDAMRSARPYRTPASHEATIEAIRADAGTRLDPMIVEWFARQASDTWERLVAGARTSWTFRDALRACCSIRPA